jgi:hypothetical protein
MSFQNGNDQYYVMIMSGINQLLSFSIMKNTWKTPLFRYPVICNNDQNSKYVVPIIFEKAYFWQIKSKSSSYVESCFISMVKTFDLRLFKNFGS